MINNEMISNINKSNFLRPYCEPATTNRSNLTQYCQSNAQQSTALILLRKVLNKPKLKRKQQKTQQNKKEKWKQ